jgi:hypothetical protein
MANPMEQEPRPGPIPHGEATGGPADVPGPDGPGPKAKGGPRRIWLVASAAGLIAGLVAWLGGEAAYGAFTAAFVEPPGWEEMGDYERPTVMAAQLKQTGPVGEARNSAVAFGLLGAALGAALGLAGGMASGGPRSGAVAAAIGLGRGGAAGAGMSLVMTPIFFQHAGPRMGLLPPALVHGGIWIPIGIAAGLAFGIGVGDRGAMVQGVIGGGLGALFGAIAFEAIHASAFPLERVESPVPGARAARLLAHLCVSLPVALGVGVTIGDWHERRRAKPPTLPE